MVSEAAAVREKASAGVAENMPRRRTRPRRRRPAPSLQPDDAQPGAGGQPAVQIGAD